MNLNKKIFIGFLSVSAAILILDFLSVENKICGDYDCRSLLQSNLLSLFIVSSMASLFSFTSLFTKGEVFVYWWRFARIFIPVILFISILLNIDSNNATGGVLMNFNDELNQVYNMSLYLLFILGSALQMYRGFQVKG